MKIFKLYSEILALVFSHKWLKGPWETNHRKTFDIHCEGNSSSWIGRQNWGCHDLLLFMKSQFKSREVNQHWTVLNVLDVIDYAPPKNCRKKFLFQSESHVTEFQCIVNKARWQVSAQILSHFTFAELSWHFITKISISRLEPNFF